MSAARRRNFLRFAWVTLAVTVVVIVWGAVVRATGSGAGCGSHWPLCNGDVVPLAPATATIIEFTHRLTSGLSLLMTVGLVVFAWRVFPAGHRARTWAVWSLVFMLGEAAIGAGIVLLGLVENNASALRAAYVSLHLTNTMLLVASMTATIRAAQVNDRSAAGGTRPAAQTMALALMIVVAAAGAVVALGDTLFPGAGMASDFDSASHFLIRLRIFHPILAAVSAVLTVWAFRNPMITSIVGVQLGLGVMNLFMHAPLALQMVHLVGSNLLWIAMVWSWFDGSSQLSTDT